MGKIRNREVCYWKKEDCLHEHCHEITAHNLQGPDGDRIREEKKCCGYAADRFIAALIEKCPDEPMNIGEQVIWFIEEGSDILNAQIKEYSDRCVSHGKG